MKKLDLIIDQDEVCCHWVQEVLDACNKEHGTEFTRDHIKNYFAMETLDPRLLKHTLAHLDKPGLYKSLKPFDGAIEGLQHLHEEGHQIFILSSVPSGVSFDEKKIWLKEHMPFISKDNFGAWGRKDRVFGDILLDDAPHHLEAFAKTGRIAAIFDSPWNQKIGEGKDIQIFNEVDKMTPWEARLQRTGGCMVRVRGWTDFVKLVEMVSSVAS